MKRKRNPGPLCCPRNPGLRCAPSELRLLRLLLRGFDKVRGEWSLMALCYNFARVLNIIGFDTFIAQLARIATRMILRLHSAAAAARRSLGTLLARLAQAITENPTIIRPRFRPAK